jgi:hypothetical protein
MRDDVPALDVLARQLAGHAYVPAPACWQALGLDEERFRHEWLPELRAVRSDQVLLVQLEDLLDLALRRGALPSAPASGPPEPARLHRRGRGTQGQLDQWPDFEAVAAHCRQPRFGLR